MATAHGIVIIDDKPHQYSVTARVVPEGEGLLYLKGRVSDTFPGYFGKIISGVRQIADYLDCNIDSANISLRLDTPNRYPLGGDSYGLPIGIAILASATAKIIPAGNCYTGGINRYGDIIQVGGIAEKRRAAAGFAFDRFFLPSQQLDFFSTFIAQCPCRSLSDAYAITFWGEK
jgi:ATP-dependent Lon protease